LRRVFGVVLFAAALTFGQQPHEPAGGASGHVQKVAPEHAETAKHGEEHEEAPMPNEIWWKLANFAVLIAGLGYLANKHAGPYLRSRTQEIQKGIRDAAQVRAEAESRAAAIESRIGNLSGEIENLRLNSKEEIAAEGARLQAETEAQIRKVQAQAEMEIASAAKNASLELKAYSAQLALELAEKQIRRRLDPAAQEELVDGFVSDIRGEKQAQVERVQ